MTRNCAILSCSLVSLLVLAAAPSAQGVGIMGTPPPAGHTIEEVATTTTEAYESVSLDSGTGAVDIELPLPVFPSSGLPAEPSQCLWSCFLSGVLLPSEVTSGELGLYPVLEGNTLHIEVEGEDVWPPDTLFLLRYVISAVAIRTSPPSPVESKSFGEIKAMFREE